MQINEVRRIQYFLDISLILAHCLYVKQEEWESVGEWMWNNKETYNGLSVLPYDGGSYTQAPFEEITEEEYNELYAKLQDIDFSKIIEEDDNTTQNEELACSGAGCDVK